MATAGVVGAGYQRPQIGIRQRRGFNQGYAGISNLAQVVAGYLCGQAHGNTTSTVEQAKRQARWQLARLFGGTVVVGLKINRALVNLVQQQAGNLGQARFGVAHGGSTIAITRAEVALAIDQRIALGKVLRHAHQRVVGRLVPMRVKAAQYIAHHPGTFHWLGTGVAIGPAKAQAHTGHAVQNAPLHGFKTIAHIG